MDLQWFVKWFNSPYYHILYQNRSLTEAEDFIQKLTQNLVVVLTSAYKRILINNKIELKLWLYSGQR